MSVSSTGFADCLTRLDTIPKNYMRVKKDLKNMSLAS